MASDSILLTLHSAVWVVSGRTFDSLLVLENLSPKPEKIKKLLSDASCVLSEEIEFHKNFKSSSVLRLISINCVGTLICWEEGDEPILVAETIVVNDLTKIMCLIYGPEMRFDVTWIAKQPL